jgi:uncharacterized membrane protein YecN with MAPEG domain
MNYLHLVMGLALVQFLYFAIDVGRARARYGIQAPAVSGNELFERHFRVQQNTLELLVVLLPSLAMFGAYLDPRWAAGLGAVYLVGRLLYATGYVRDPKARSLGFLLSFLPIVVLLVGAIFGAVRAEFFG